jgi:hypothetical protein
MSDIIAEVESFLANGGEPMSDYFLDEKGRLWWKGEPALGKFTDDELRTVYGDNWQQARGKINSGDDVWRGWWQR